MAERLDYSSTAETDEENSFKQQKAEQKLATFRDESTNPPPGPDPLGYLEQSPHPHERSLITYLRPNIAHPMEKRPGREARAMSFAMNDHQEFLSEPELIRNRILEILDGAGPQDPETWQDAPDFAAALRFVERHAPGEREDLTDRVRESLEQNGNYLNAAKLGQAIALEGYRTDDPGLVAAGESVMELSANHSMTFLTGAPGDSDAEQFRRERVQEEWLAEFSNRRGNYGNPFDNPEEAARQLTEKAEFAAWIKPGESVHLDDFVTDFLVEHTLKLDMLDAAKSAAAEAARYVNTENRDGQELAQALERYIQEELYSASSERFMRASFCAVTGETEKLAELYQDMAWDAISTAVIAEQHRDGTTKWDAGPREMTNEEAVDLFDRFIENIPQPTEGNISGTGLSKSGFRDHVVRSLTDQRETATGEMQMYGPEATSKHMENDSGAKTQTIILAQGAGEILA